MIERPILMNAPMVLSTLAGFKTQTRRVVKFKTAAEAKRFSPELLDDWEWASPYGDPGDRLWVRETWAATARQDELAPKDFPADVGVFMYRADRPNETPSGCAGGLGKWRPSIHMPRRFSRLTLEVKGVRVERLKAISREDAIAEGIRRVHGFDVPAAMGGLPEGTWSYSGAGDNWWGTPEAAFASLWRSVYGAASWAANPWVWVIDFKRVTP